MLSTDPLSLKILIAIPTVADALLLFHNNTLSCVFLSHHIAVNMAFSLWSYKSNFCSLSACRACKMEKESGGSLIEHTYCDSRCCWRFGNELMFNIDFA